MTALLLAAALGAPAAIAADRTDPLAGRTPGPPARCIPIDSISTPSIVDARTILYAQSGKRIWRTTPVGRCTRMQPTDTLVVEVFGGQICRNDRFRVLSPGLSIPSAPCRFDAFVPYDKP